MKLNLLALLLIAVMGTAVMGGCASSSKTVVTTLPQSHETGPLAELLEPK